MAVKHGISMIEMHIECIQLGIKPLEFCSNYLGDAELDTYLFFSMYHVFLTNYYAERKYTSMEKSNNLLLQRLNFTFKSDDSIHFNENTHLIQNFNRQEFTVRILISQKL